MDSLFFTLKSVIFTDSFRNMTEKERCKCCTDLEPKICDDICHSLGIQVKVLTNYVSQKRKNFCTGVFA